MKRLLKDLERFGYMSNLNRIQVGNFHILDAIPMEKLEDPDFLNRNSMTVEKLFEKKEKMILENNRTLTLFLNGVKLSYNKPNGLYRIYFERSLYRTWNSRK